MAGYQRDQQPAASRNREVAERDGRSSALVDAGPKPGLAWAILSNSRRGNEKRDHHCIFRMESEEPASPIEHEQRNLWPFVVVKLSPETFVQPLVVIAPADPLFVMSSR